MMFEEVEFTPLHVVSKRTTDNSVIEIEYSYVVDMYVERNVLGVVVDVEAKRSNKIISRNPYKVANFTSKKSYN